MLHLTGLLSGVL